MSLQLFFRNAAKDIRYACFKYRKQFKTTNAFQIKNLKLENCHHPLNNSKHIRRKVKVRYVEALQSFHKIFSQSKKCSLALGCTVIGAYGLVSFIEQFVPNIEWDGIAHLFVNSVEAITPNLSRHNFIADVVDKTGPAVTFLEIKGQHPDSGRRITESNGSGFLVRPNGLILTNAHVVANKYRSKVMVRLHNGDIYEGKVTAVDPVHDLATIKIEPKTNLPYIPLERSSNIRPGEFVIAMGSPLSLSNTVTSGIVSSSLRGSKELGFDNKNMQYIQTDAVITYGNSGGPLVNLEGKAIGINNLKVTSGISFAIPADYAFGFIEEAERIMEKTSKSNKPLYFAGGKESPNKRRFMGIKMLDLTPLLINEHKDKIRDFPTLDNGVYVQEVIVGSPAYDGGLHAGDIIVEVNGNKISSTSDVYTCVEKDPRLRITAVRGNYTQNIEVVTEELFF